MAGPIFAASKIATGQNALSTADEQVLAARPTRRRAVIKNDDAVITVYVGVEGVSSSDGLVLLTGESVEVFTTAAVWAIAASGTPSVSFIEEFD